MRFSISRFLPRSTFGKGVASLTSGTVLGQLLLLAASPVVTRLYSAEDFGVFGVFVSLVSILSVISSLRYQIAIPIPESDKQASNLAALALAIVVVFSAIVACVVYPARNALASITNTPGLSVYVWLLPIAIFLVGTYQVLNYWTLRNKTFTSIGQAKALQGAARGIGQISLGPLTGGPSGLISGYLLGWGVAVCHLARRMYQHAYPLQRCCLSVGEMASVAKRFRRFPLFSSWSAVFNTISAQLPTLLLASFFGPMIAGLYSLTRQVLSAPMQFVGKAVSQAFLAEAPSADREGRLRTLTMNIFRHLVRLAAPVCLVLGVAAPEVFALVFGGQWRVSGVYCQWLTGWLFLVFVCSPLSMIPSVMGKQRQELVFHATLLVLRTVALLAGSTLGSPAMALGLFAAVSALSWFCFMLWSLGLTGNRLREVLASIAGELWPNILLSVPLVACKILFRQDGYVLGSAAFSGLLMAIRVLVLVRRDREDAG